MTVGIKRRQRLCGSPMPIGFWLLNSVSCLLNSVYRLLPFVTMPSDASFPDSRPS
jgi:hypothetical protein